MPSQALGFAEVLAGGVLLTAAITGASISDTLKGRAGNVAGPLDLSGDRGDFGGVNPDLGGGTFHDQSFTTPGISSGNGQVILQSGVNVTQGVEPQIEQRLRALSAFIGKPVYIISGYRTPAHSVQVGGFANDPHTRGEAADIGIGSPLRDSVASIPESIFRRFGLYRPFYPQSAAEVNHVQLLP